MTDFFARQDDARRRTARLVALFVLAVIVIVAAVYGVATAVVMAGAGRGQAGEPPEVFSASRLGLVATAVLLVITTGSLYKIATLRDGGDAIAQLLGGRPVEPAAAAPAERRLLNVVEEMALASGTPVPPVYVLDGEPGINAFAAGFTPGDAVIAVSRGALDHLTRDELQGVIGHEFSHILNGDMRLNLRLIGLVHGILMIALIGQLLLRAAPGSRGGRRDKYSDDAWMLFVGVGLLVIGSLGVLLGRIIKCAISRQREFLADASSVQFTRNPDGIAGALKKIGGLAEGSRVRSPNAEQACHMFFGQGVPSLSSLLATHPPLAERIRRLDPSFDGRFPDVPEAPVEVGPEPGEAEALAVPLSSRRWPSPGKPEEFSLDPAAAVASVGTPTAEHVAYASALLDTLPPGLAAATSSPFSARAVVYALLLDPDDAVRRAQLARLEGHSEPGTVREVLRLRPAVASVGEDGRIPLVDLTFPALRRLSDAQYRAFRANVDALVQADRRVSLFEYALHRMLLRHLDQAFFRLPPPVVQFQAIDGVFPDCVLLISTLARLGHEDGTSIERAFATGMARLQKGYPGERAVALRPPEACSLGAVDRALSRLARAAPPVKRRVLDACAACIAVDLVVTPAEAELLRAIADSLDCPMPPLLPPAVEELTAEGAERRQRQLNRR
jgi:Zn-dependent protease with chaperone function